MPSNATSRRGCEGPSARFLTIALLVSLVTIVTGRSAARAARGERVLGAHGVELVHMGLALPLYGNGSQTLHTVFPLGTLQLRRFFAARQFDVVHIHAPYNPSFLHARAPSPAGRSVGVGTYHRSHAGRCANSCTRRRAPSLGRLDGPSVSEACIPPLDH